MAAIAAYSSGRVAGDRYRGRAGQSAAGQEAEYAALTAADWGTTLTNGFDRLDHAPLNPPTNS